MILTITATYREPAAMLNAADELINRGIPREQIHRRADSRQVKVIIPSVCEPEVNEALLRHRPAAFTGSSGRIVGCFEDEMPQPRYLARPPCGRSAAVRNRR